MKPIATNCFIGCISALAFAYFYFSAIPIKENTISCQSRHTLTQNNFTLDANYGFIIGDDKGELTIDGYSKEDGVSTNIRRAINFTYSKTDNIYRLHNEGIESLSGDDSEKSSINAHIPAFFYQKGEYLTMQIKHDKFNAPIFILHGMPFFYCKKTR